MSLPAHLKTHTITIEPYEGQGSTGPVFGTAVEVQCRVEDKVQLVRSNIGDEVVSSSMVFCDPGTVAPPESRVTVNGRVTSVVQTADHATGGFSHLDHVQLFLK